MGPVIAKNRGVAKVVRNASARAKVPTNVPTQMPPHPTNSAHTPVSITAQTRETGSSRETVLPRIPCAGRVPHVPPSSRSVIAVALVPAKAIASARVNAVGITFKDMPPRDITKPEGRAVAKASKLRVFLALQINAVTPPLA